MFMCLFCFTQLTLVKESRKLSKFCYKSGETFFCEWLQCGRYSSRVGMLIATSSDLLSLCITFHLWVCYFPPPPYWYTVIFFFPPHFLHCGDLIIVSVLWLWSRQIRILYSSQLPTSRQWRKCLTTLKVIKYKLISSWYHLGLVDLDLDPRLWQGIHNI